MRAVLAFALLVLVVIAILPSSLGSGTPPTTYSAPYIGGQKVTRGSTSYFIGSCPSVNTSTFKSASASLSSGVVRVDAVASINGTCSGRIGGVEAEAQAGIRSPVFIAPNSGKVNVSFRWELTWTISAKWHGTGDSNSEGEIIGFLWDLTTNSPVAHSRQVDGFADLNGFNQGTNHANDTNETLSISGILTAGDSYRAVTLVQATAGSELNLGSGGASAMANLAFRGGYGSLSSVVVG
jgi:hypothetical protein